MPTIRSTEKISSLPRVEFPSILSDNLGLGWRVGAYLILPDCLEYLDTEWIARYCTQSKDTCSYIFIKFVNKRIRVI